MIKMDKDVTAVEFLKGEINKLLWRYDSSFDDFIRVEEEGEGNGDGTFSHRTVFRFYTTNNRYTIVLHETEKGIYLGASVCSRYWEPGEDWHRGSDLPDGSSLVETWEEIKNAIIGYELVKWNLPRVCEACEECEPVEGPSIE